MAELLGDIFWIATQGGLEGQALMRPNTALMLQ